MRGEISSEATVRSPPEGEGQGNSQGRRGRESHLTCSRDVISNKVGRL